METLTREFKIGDKVRIRKSSQFYKCNTSYNPRNKIGVIIDTNNHGVLNLRVDWSDDRSGKPNNSYMDEDLELVESIINYSIPGTPMPDLKKGTRIRVIHWPDSTTDNIIEYNNFLGYVSYGQTIKDNEVWIMFERPEYLSGAYWIVRKKDLIELTSDIKSEDKYLQPKAPISLTDKSYTLGEIEKALVDALRDDYEDILKIIKTIK